MMSLSLEGVTSRSHLLYPEMSLGALAMAYLDEPNLKVVVHHKIVAQQLEGIRPSALVYAGSCGSCGRCHGDSYESVHSRTESFLHPAFGLALMFRSVASPRVAVNAVRLFVVAVHG